MIKSLYIRVIFTFLLAVLISVMLGFVITVWLYNDKLNKLIQEELVSNGNRIIQEYQATDVDDLETFIRGISTLPEYSIRIFDHEGKELHIEQNRTDSVFLIDPEQISMVLNGQVFSNFSHNNKNQSRLIGIPFERHGNKYALFIKPKAGGPREIISFPLISQLLVVLLFGSFFVLIAARYIVRPLQHLTEASRKMAKGNFNVHLQTNRKDEIGELTKSFNQMAVELGKLELMRQQFVSDVSHEFQSPLTSIKGFTAALKTKNMDESSRLNLLNIIEQESNRLSRLSRDLLQLSSLEYGHVQLDKKTYRLDEQIRHIIIFLEPQWAGKKREISIDLPKMMIQADKDKLNQLWTNLLGNSIKFTGENGIIGVEGRMKENCVCIKITDSGRGIAKEEINNIFMPFYKVDKSRTAGVANGNGIGLSIVKRIVELHQGDISVSSEPMQGTTFTIKLPHSKRDT